VSATYNDITNEVIAVVFELNGSDDYYPCHTSRDITNAEKVIQLAGGTPVTFYREGHGPASVTNISTGGGFGIQAGTIHGGVRF
jgi:hypothetical protein